MVKTEIIDKTIYDIVKKFASHISDKGISVKHAILFGSYARGNQKKDSDIDICIVSPDFGRDSISELQFLLKETRHVDDRIEPIPFNIDELNSKYSTLSSESSKIKTLIDLI